MSTTSVPQKMGHPRNPRVRLCGGGGVCVGRRGEGGEGEEEVGTLEVLCACVCGVCVGHGVRSGVT